MAYKKQKSKFFEKLDADQKESIDYDDRLWY